MPRPEGKGILSGSARGVDLPAPLSTYTLQPAVPSAGGGVTSASPHRPHDRQRNVDRFSIGIAVRLSLRDRLTPGRLTLPGNPWSCGGGESHPPYRYLYLHLLFQTLQRGSRTAFDADWNAPLPIHYGSHGFGGNLDTRLLSMPPSSTSELLRTL